VCGGVGVYLGVLMFQQFEVAIRTYPSRISMVSCIMFAL
jgi:hypothetical protein